MEGSGLGKETADEEGLSNDLNTSAGGVGGRGKEEEEKAAAKDGRRKGEPEETEDEDDDENDEDGRDMGSVKTLRAAFS